MGRDVEVESYRLNIFYILYSTSESVFDGLGRLLAVYQNRADADIPMKTMQYDTAGRKLVTDDRDSGIWKYGYDNVGNLLWQEDPKEGQHLQFCYDDLDRPLHKCIFNSDDFGDIGGAHYACTPALCDESVDYEYDNETQSQLSIGALTRVSDAAGEMRSLDFDTRGRSTGYVRQIGYEDEMGATVVGEAEFHYGYNINDEVVRTTYPDGEVIETTYDESGQPIMLSNQGGQFFVSSVHYDVRGRPKSVVKGNSTTDESFYHGATKNHRLRSTQFIRVNHLEYEQTYEYNARGQVETLATLTGTNSPLHNGGVYSYDAFGRMTGYDSTRDGVGQKTYQYNKWGNITRRDTHIFSYPDPLVAVSPPHQVSTVTVGGGSPSGVNHDANGNRSESRAEGVLSVLSYDAEDRLERSITQGDIVEYVYDHSGQQAMRTFVGPSGDEITKYYAPEMVVQPDGTTVKSYFLGGQRIASVTLGDSNWQTASIDSSLWGSPVEFASQWAGVPVVMVTLSRSAEQILAGSLSLFLVTLFLMPPGRRRRVGLGLRIGRAPVTLVAVTILTGTMPWPLLVEPAAACEGCDCPTPTPIPAADIDYYHYGYLGSPLMVTDGDGAVVEHIRYDPYGKVRGRYDSSGAPITDPGPQEVRYEFTGYEAERTTGLLYANARFYDPEMGSFLTHDPAAEFWSPYTYAGWDPGNLTDPTGESVGLAFAAVGIFLLGFAVSALVADNRGASTGEALKAGAIGGASAVVGAGVGYFILAPVTSTAVAAVVGPSVGGVAASDIAAAVLFSAGLGQSAYSASQGDPSGLISLGIGLAVGAIAGRLAKGAQASGAKASQGDNGVQLAADYGSISDASNDIRNPQIVEEIRIVASRVDGLREPWFSPIDVITGLAGAGLAYRGIVGAGSRAVAARGGGKWTKEVVTRKAPGADGATSRHILEKLDGKTNSVTHQVTKDGKVIPQHQTHIGTNGGQRQFPDEWVEFPKIPGGGQ